MPPGLSSAKLMSLKGPMAPIHGICRVGEKAVKAPTQHQKAGEEARNSHVVPDRVGQDDNTALTFLQALGCLHGNRHGAARAASWVGTKKRETSIRAAQGVGPQSQCMGHSTAIANGTEAPRQSSSRGGTSYTRLKTLGRGEQSAPQPHKL